MKYYFVLWTHCLTKQVLKDVFLGSGKRFYYFQTVYGSNDELINQKNVTLQP